MTLLRRAILMGSATGLLGAQSSRPYRVALIGATGRGDYGHDWDLAWKGMPGVTVAAVSDHDEAGCNRAIARSGALRGYHDYRQMIDREKPDIVTICPRWLDQRPAMFAAAAEAGAHILMEKPFAASLHDADLMVAAAQRHKVKVQVGHTARIAAVTRRVREIVAQGTIGDPLEMRARGKEDRRAGGEDLIVLGTHTFDLMRYFAGDPQWTFAHMTQDQAEVRQSMLREGSEPAGKISGDQVAAMFCFSDNLHGYFGSKASRDRTGRRFGVTLYGSAGAIFVPLFGVPSTPAFLLRQSDWVADKQHGWEAVEYPPGTELATRESANQAMARDLLEAIESDRDPACSALDGRWTIEMTAAIYQSQFERRPVAFPLNARA